MKLEIEKEKLNEMLQYLIVADLYEFPELTVDGEGFIQSIQETSDHSVFRYVKFSPSYFKDIEKKEETIKIDGKKLEKIIANEDPKSSIKIETKDGRLFVFGDRTKADLNLVEVDETKIRKSLPFSIKDGVPYFKKKTTPLDTWMSLDLSSFKSICDYAKILETEFFKFLVDEKNKVTIKVGDLEGYAETIEYEPKAEIKEKNSEIVDVVLTRGIKELSDTFKNNIGVRMKTGFPAWFFEGEKTYKFGVLVAPHRREN